MESCLCCFFRPPFLLFSGLQQCVIKKIRRPHLEKNSTASRRGGGSAARRRPQPSSLHNCGFSGFSQIQEYASSHGRRLESLGRKFSLCKTLVLDSAWLCVSNPPNDFGTVIWQYVSCFCTATETNTLCSLTTAGKHVWEILIIMTQLLHLKGYK